MRSIDNVFHGREFEVFANIVQASIKIVPEYQYRAYYKAARMFPSSGYITIVLGIKLYYT